MTPLVSVIISAYNPGPYLTESIQSVLQQTYNNIEVLIIDDGSTDGSVERAREQFQDARLRWFHQKNSGKPTALNRALQACNGDYYAIQDADDVSHPHRVECLLDALVSNPDVAAVFSGHELIMGNRRIAPRLRAKSREECLNDVRNFRMPAHDPTGMYRVSMVRDIEYEPSLRIVEGYDYILRVGERWPMMVLGECLYSYRVHPNSITRQNVLKRHAAVELVRRRAAERRGVAVEALEAPNPIRNRHRDNGLHVHFLESVVDLRRIGHNLSALKTAAHCAMLHPFDHDYYKPLAAALLPQRVLRRLRRREREDTPT